MLYLHLISFMLLSYNNNIRSCDSYDELETLVKTGHAVYVSPHHLRKNHYQDVPNLETQPGYDTELRMIGGHTALPGEYPFHVSIMLQIKYNLCHIHLCGGALINRITIITTGHCVTNMYFQDDKEIQFFVGAGSTKLHQNMVLRKVVSYCVHPDYHYTSTDNNIGIIKVETAFPFNSLINSIPLSKNNPALYKGCLTTGWDKLTGLDPPPPLLLHGLDIRVIEDSKCQKEFIFQGLNYEEKVLEQNLIFQSNKMICVSSSKNNRSCPCLKDAGGPLVCDNKLFGVLSFGFRYCSVDWLEYDSTNHPFVFISVAHYYDWIVKNLNNKTVNENCKIYGVHSLMAKILTALIATILIANGLLVTAGISMLCIYVLRYK